MFLKKQGEGVTGFFKLEGCFLSDALEMPLESKMSMVMKENISKHAR